MLVTTISSSCSVSISFARSLSRIANQLVASHATARYHSGSCVRIPKRGKNVADMHLVEENDVARVRGTHRSQPQARRKDCAAFVADNDAHRRAYSSTYRIACPFFPSAFRFVDVAIVSSLRRIHRLFGRRVVAHKHTAYRRQCERVCYDLAAPIICKLRPIMYESNSILLLFSHLRCDANWRRQRFSLSPIHSLAIFPIHSFRTNSIFFFSGCRARQRAIRFVVFVFFFHNRRGSDDDALHL